MLLVSVFEVLIGISSTATCFEYLAWPVGAMNRKTDYRTGVVLIGDWMETTICDRRCSEHPVKVMHSSIQALSLSPRTSC